MEEKKEKMPYEKAEMQIIEIQNEGFLTNSGHGEAPGGTPGTAPGLEDE